MPESTITLIVSRMATLNNDIKSDPLLGENYQIGHSYFCPKGNDFTGLDRNWYENIIETEIAPLLKEYWFDNSKKAEDTIKRLLG